MGIWRRLTKSSDQESAIKQSLTDEKWICQPSNSANHLDFKSDQGVNSDPWKQNTMQRVFGPDWPNSGGVGGYLPSPLRSRSPWL
jgi:hypothetical protein